MEQPDLLSYRNGGPGYQAHSRTSRAAAENRPNAGGQRETVFQFIVDSGTLGATTDEIRNGLLAVGKIHQNSVMSARVRELEMADRIVKTTKMRETSAGHNANVYVTAEVFRTGGFTRDISKEPPELKNNPKAKWRKYSAYHEDFSFVLWHIVPVNQPPYVGTPGCSDWPYRPEDEANLRWAILPEGPKE